MSFLFWCLSLFNHKDRWAHRNRLQKIRGKSLRASSAPSVLLWLLCLMTACTPTPAAPTPTPVVIAKLLATAYISPTPNPEQLAATRAASTPTPIPLSPTPIPSPTPYIGIFIGEAPREDGGISPITAPLFAPQAGTNPTADATRCTLPVNPLYLQVWQTTPIVTERLGCPIQENQGFFGEVQIFEKGVIYWRRDNREMWIMVPGTNNNAGRAWFVTAPEFVSTEGITAPTPGLLIPEGDFGSVWMSVPGLREALGFAQTERQSVAMNVQRYATGSFFLDATAGQIFALVVDGTVYGPFNAPRPGEEPQLPASAADLFSITLEPLLTPTTVTGP